MHRDAPPAHYVRHNLTTRIPRNWICFDTEAQANKVGRNELQTFRLACAIYDSRRHDRDTWRERQSGVFHSTDALWAWIDARCERKARTVCVAHNLAYDLRISRAFTELPALGWELKDVRLDRGSTFAEWRRDTRTLVCMDSFSWLPASLAQIGAWVGLEKLALPPWDDTPETWAKRCWRDVEILAEANRRLVDWVRADDLGNWRATGAGQAWSAYRHRFMEHKLLAHDNDDARAAERRSAWTGRCEVWQWGTPTGGPFTEFDYSAAYARVGAECDVPVRLVGESRRPTLSQLDRLSTRYAVLADVEVTTDVPTLPTLYDDRIIWPVGHFSTSAWDCELTLARAHGATVTVRRLWWYRRAPALREFARWCLGVLYRNGAGFDPVVVCAIKHWSRALVGRFGSRWSGWDTVGSAPTDDLRLSTVIDPKAGERYDLLQVGTTLKRRTELRDSRDAVIAIMAWVMAQCRVRLWELVETAGAEHVVYMDTDGLIVNRFGAERLRAARIDGLRPKGEWGSVEMLAPRSMVLAGNLRASGVPKSSTRVGAHTWDGDVWQELTSSLRAGSGDTVRVSKRRVQLSGRDLRREHLECGRTAPYVLR